MKASASFSDEGKLVLTPIEVQKEKSVSVKDAKSAPAKNEEDVDEMDLFGDDDEADESAAAAAKAKV